MAWDLERSSSRLTLVTPEYAAGFFDGEGTVYIRKARNGKYWHYRLEVAVGNTNREVLEAHKETFGGAVYEINIKRVIAKGWSRQYKWQMNCSQAEVFLAAIAPHVIIKREYVELGLLFRKAANVAEKIELFNRYKEMRSTEVRTKHFFENRAKAATA